jgi:ATP-binding cassette, subfamily B, bacterial
MAQGSTLYNALLKLHRLIMVDRKDVSSVYFFAIIGGLVSLILPLGIQTILNFVMAASLSTSVIILIIIVIGGVFFNGFVQIRQMQVIERIRQKIFTRYSLEFGHRIPQMNLQEMDSYYLPEVVNRFFDVVALAKSIEKVLVDIPTSIIQILLGLILLSFYHPIFIAFGAVVLIVLIVILRLTSTKGFTTSMQASDYKYKTAGWLQEVARCAKTFKYSKGSNLNVQNTDQIIEGYLESRTAHFKILNTQFWSLIAFKVLIVAIMLIAGTWLLLDQQINVGQFIASDIVIILIINSVEKLIGTMDNVYDSLTSIEKISKIVDSQTEDSGKLSFAENERCSVSFQQVGYVYPDGSEALKDVNFTVQPNQLVCIKGESGSGRSTITRLLTGSYTDFTGSILLNNIPIGNYKLDEMRKHTGIMFMGQDIFKGTILQNLTMGNEDIKISDVTYLADKIGLTEFIVANKHGYDTMLDPTGKRLSNYVIQNIKLIRALLGKPCLLLLEEPAQHLNEEKKSVLIDYLKNEAAATVLIISNSRAIENNADIVLTLEDGILKNNL